MDLWQKKLILSDSRRVILNISRQAGKTFAAALLTLRAALLEAPALVLLLSPTGRQSGESFRAVLDAFHALGDPVATTYRSALRLELANGSRIVALPGMEGTIRGYSGVALLVIDEAAQVPDGLYRTVRPMLAVSGGRMIVLSTPFGKRGFFYDLWISKQRWDRIEVNAEQCPRISATYLAEEKEALGERWFRQEFFCSFEETLDAVFSSDDIDGACDDTIEPLFATAG